MRPFKGKLISCVKQRRRLPNGNVVNLEIIKHPGATLIVPFLNKNTIIFIRQFRPVINSYLYELPAGTLDKGETPARCARREIIEETGYAAGKMTLLGKIFPVPGYSTEIITIFKAEKLEKRKKDTQADEIIRVCVLSRPRVKKLFKKGLIKDAKTICALAFCGRL